MGVQTPNIHPVIAEADRQASLARAEVLNAEFTRLQERIDELEAENQRLQGAG